MSKEKRTIDAQPIAMAADPRVGRWTLTSPDGRMFFGESQLAALREERNSRMSASEQLENIRKGMEEADQPADAVVVPLDLIKRIDDALGAFTGDEELLNSHIDTYNDVREIRAAQEGK